MKTKTKPLITFNWKIAFLIMTGMFVALLFYTVVLSLQVRQGLRETYKKMKMQSMQPGMMADYRSMMYAEAQSSNEGKMTTDAKTGNKMYSTKYFNISLPENWEMKKFEYPLAGTMEAFVLTNTKSEMIKKNGSGMEPKESIFLRIEDKKNIPATLEDRIRRFTGFDSAATAQITVNGKSTPVAYGGGEGTFGWYTFIEDDTKVAVFQSKNGDSKIKTSFYPGVGEQNEIISSFSFN
jgi:hypothetical protein